MAGEFDALASLFGNNPLDYNRPSPTGNPDADVVMEIIAQLQQPSKLPGAVEPERLGKGAVIGGSIADALVSYARGRGANIAPQDTIARLQQFRQQQADLENQTNMRQFAVNERARRSGLQAKLDTELGRRQTEARAAESAADRELTREQIASRERTEAATLDLRGRIAQMEDETRRALAQERKATTTAQERNASTVSSSDILRGIIETKKQLRAGVLPEGMTADDVREDILDAIEVSPLLDEDKQRILAKFNRDIEPLLTKIEEAEVAAANTPEAKRDAELEAKREEMRQRMEVERQAATERARSVQVKLDDLLSNPRALNLGGF